MHTVVDAINSLECVVKGNESKLGLTELYYRSVTDADQDTRFSLVGAALHNLGVTVSELIGMGPLKIDYLYEEGKLPFDLSLGALAVYRAAQRTQDGLTGGDRSWGAAFDNAVVAASRVIDLMPESVVATARAELVIA